MHVRLGIGIVTFNRRDVLGNTLDRVLHHTKYPSFTIAVADDGSTDGTPDMLRARDVLHVTGRNMGISWNKNRALFLLSQLCRCDVVILLEDDTSPTADHWERDWIAAAIRWGHVNTAGDWLAQHFMSGAGTPEDPVLSTHVTAQCAAFSREALLFGGYFDTRFRGYGHEHVEHTCRLVRLGYGGMEDPDHQPRRILYRLIRGAVEVNRAAGSHFNQEQVDRNLQVARELLHEFTPRLPWRDEDEARQFRDEMRGSVPPVL